ncbi:hypothetical protein LGK95_00620 [Clostridium algoriphilum]|uniref:hypothetical protein n=1 Tax=Clostridium algoriphilum TaxID=198347 RepID=UPI001CF4E8C8|nr:hypothetical protein [Clostridium algoriphilum]MCB2292042.1 hypothetical protein [Clostridium algoriphilum]
MKRYYKFFGRQFGIIIACLGIGIITVVIVPFWWWIIVVGGGVVYLGFTIMNHNNHC